MAPAVRGLAGKGPAGQRLVIGSAGVAGLSAPLAGPGAVAGGLAAPAPAAGGVSGAFTGGASGLMLPLGGMAPPGGMAEPGDMAEPGGMPEPGLPAAGMAELPAAGAGSGRCDSVAACVSGASAESEQAQIAHSEKQESPATREE